jgi:tetratricopeptide (TPR) repeat protein
LKTHFTRTIPLESRTVLLFVDVMTMTVAKLFVSLFYLFVAASAQDSMSAGKLRSMGEEAFIAGQYDDALKYYGQAVGLEPENAINHFKLFRVHQRMRRYAEALKNLTRALELKPDSDDYRLQKVKLLKSLGQCEEALIVVQPLKGQDDLQEQVKSCAEDIQSAQQMIFAEKWQEAAHYLDRAMKHVEQATDLTFQRAQAMYHLGDYYGTISDLGRVLKAHSNHIEAYELRGQAYFRLGDHDTAVNHYREGLKLDPEHKGCKAGHKFVKSIEKKNKRGDDAFAKGNYEEALSNWWQAIEIDTTHVAFFRPTLLKIVKAHTKLGQHDKAIEEATKHVNNVETVEGLYALAEAQQGGDKYQDAVNTYRRAAEIAVRSQGVQSVVSTASDLYSFLFFTCSIA